MSENNSKIPSIVALILLVLILAGVFYATAMPKTQKPNPTDKCPAAQAPTTTNIKPVDQEQLKKITIEDTQLGTGQEVKSGDVVCIDYKGSLIDGKVFDESYKRGQPFVTQIGVGRVIPGWDLGIVGLKEGGKRKLTIPAELAYGSKDSAAIPANSTLVFEVQLVKIVK